MKEGDKREIERKRDRKKEREREREREREGERESEREKEVERAIITITLSCTLKHESTKTITSLNSQTLTIHRQSLYPILSFPFFFYRTAVYF